MLSQKDSWSQGKCATEAQTELSRRTQRSCRRGQFLVSQPDFRCQLPHLS